MSDQSTIPLPEPGSLRIGEPPYWRNMPGIVPIAFTFMLAASLTMVAGMFLFGWNTVRVLAISVAVALLVESTFSLLSHRTRVWSESHALLMGILFACTLPPTVSWHVPMIGSALAVMLGQILPGGLGSYMWHPAVVGRIAVQILFHEQVTPKWCSVLAPGHLLWGDIDRAAELPRLSSWSTAPLADKVEAWMTLRPVDQISLPISSRAGDSLAETLAALVRDVLPAWPDTLLGIAGGAIGEACVIAVLVAGLILFWRGLLRWPMVVAGIVSAAVLAAILPVRIQLSDGTMIDSWWPGLAVWQGLPVGLVYVCYQLTAGGFLLVLLLLAPDPSSSPLTLRGHMWFGLIIGAGTIVLRVSAGLPASAYWALLIANTFVPMINRATRRRVFGTW
ncbi:MAG: RnfABCDGE type electron transport complex subunit D [Planctomycetota bacterium]|jgi:electron transport complex protein RnfD